jgi:integrase
MALTDKEIKAIRPGKGPSKKYDEKGLYVETTPSGSKLWRLKYRFAGKEKRLAFGAYPEVGLSEARKRRDEARKLIASGVDPSMERKRRKAAAIVSASHTFEAIADEYISNKMEKEGRAASTVRKARWFLSLLKPAIGNSPVSEVNPQMLLAVLRRLEGKGNYETAKKTRSFASRVFNYAVITEKTVTNPAVILQGALTSPQAKHYAAILDPSKLGELLRAIDAFAGNPITKYALLIAPHVFVRPGELRHADWAEFDFDKAVWQIPAGKMKARRDHTVPLSKQVIALFKELRELTGPKGYSFPSLRTSRRPMSDNTINAAFRRMGFGKEEITAHGLRSTASTLLNESQLWSPDAIERALSHGDSNVVRAAYHRGAHWRERVDMAQWWSDYLDELRDRRPV